MTLNTKLISSFLGCGLIPLSIVAYVSYSTADGGMDSISTEAGTALEKKAFNQLVALRDVKKAQIENYFNEREGDMGVLVENVAALRQGAFAKLEAIQELKKKQINGLFQSLVSQMHVLKDDPYTRQALTEFKEAFEAAGDRVDTPEWEAVAARYDARFKDIMTDNGWYDLFLIHTNGNIVYTVGREPDLGMIIPDSELKDSALGVAFTKATNGNPDEVTVGDFAPYAPSNGAQAAFMIGQLRDDSGHLVGYAALQIPTGPFNAVVQQRDGMGVTGETYLVGKANGRTAFRSDMLTMGDGKFVIGAEIHTEYIDRIIDTGEGFQSTYVDSSGKPVMIAADSLEIDGLHWACISKMDLEEAIALRVEGEKDDFFTKYNNLYGYYDLFLINPQGYCFYSVCREADYHTNFVDGKYASSNLGKLTRSAIQSKKFGFADFEPYAPSNGTPAAFIAQPVLYDGNVEVIVALQLPLKAINHIMGVRAGMGETGETYLVGPDKLMRSDSFLDPTHHTVATSFANPSTGSVNTDAANAALSGTVDAKIVTDYNGNPVLSAYAPINVFGTRWALLAEIDESEAMAAVEEMNAVSSAATTRLVTWVGVLGGIAAILVALISVFIARSISRPINRIIAGLNEGANQVNDAASQVSTASQNLAEGASEQASSLEETSSALEEMAAMTRTNAENAKQANELSGQARTAAEKGDGTMEQLNAAMTAINDSSGQISKIIKVIEEIAFQTNLLALNAAVEAARAGEHGKGFAVVADEVRNLAQRAAQAARETTGLIEDSVSRAKEGTEVASEVAGALGAIVGDVTKVTDLIEGITKASEEQAQGVDQVNIAVSQMDKVTQGNAAGAEESASASEQLAAQSQAVKGMIDELSGLIHGTTKAMQQTATAAPPPRRRPVAQAASTRAPAVAAASHTVASRKPKPAPSADEFMSLDDDDKNLGDF